MASLRLINKIIPSRSIACVFRSKNISSVVSSSAKKSRTFMSVVARGSSPGLYLPTSALFSRVCSCGIHNNISEGDQQLLAFVKEEINYETETMKSLEKPKLEIFSQPDNLKEIKFKITRLLNGERVIVSFDVDQSINHEAEGPDDDDDDNEQVGKITSYPSFSVQIIKDSGETLHFNCEYDIEEGEDSTDDEGNELFSINDVSLLPHPDADHRHIYHCETENMDYNLYELLMAMLAERGVNNEFLTDLLKKSTILEHQHYMQFLQGLQDFLTQK